MKEKKTNEVNCLRLSSNLLPISKKAKKTHPEVDFDFVWGIDDFFIYTIDDSGNFCEEVVEMNKKTKEFELVEVKKINITQEVYAETEIEGRPARFKIAIEKGKVISIKKSKLITK